jgi:hypothetical protein
VPGISQVSLVVGLGVVARQGPVGSEHKLANSVIFARTGWAYPHLRITAGVVRGRGQGRAPAGPGAVATPLCQARAGVRLDAVGARAPGDVPAYCGVARKN